MNFLQLCQEAARDSGTVAGVPSFTTVVGVTGRVEKFVGWVRDAWIDIQNERNDWQWMRRSFSQALTINTTTYTAAELGIADFGSWLHDLPALGWRNLTIYEAGDQANEGELREIGYPLYRQRYMRGTHDANKPTEWAVTPINSLAFGNKPDKAYIVQGEYRKEPQRLEADADIPEMPEQFHRLIIGEALRLMAESDEVFNVLGVKAQKYERLRNPLVIDQTPQVEFGGGSFA